MSLLVDIEKRLGDFHLRVQLEAGDETLALLGESGCGKSMTLQCIAGLQRPDRGVIVADGVTLFHARRRIDLSPQQRRTGLLFQNYALFPHMTVLENLRAGARREGDPAAREERIAALLEQYGLTLLAGHYPSQLSGGQQQRAALARLLLSNPRTLLLDEPFSALDRHLRFRLEGELRQTLGAFPGTAVLVSHDHGEVYRLADKVAVLDGGAVIALGGRDEVFHRPRTRKAALLTGCENLSPCRPLPHGRVEATDWGIALTLPPGAPPPAYVGIRARALRAEAGENALPCAVVETLNDPGGATALLRPVGSAALPLVWKPDRLPREGVVTLRLPPEELLLLEE